MGVLARARLVSISGRRSRIGYCHCSNNQRVNGIAASITLPTFFGCLWKLFLEQRHQPHVFRIDRDGDQIAERGASDAPVTGDLLRLCD